MSNCHWTELWVIAMAAKHVQFSSDFLSSMTLDGAYTDAAAVADVADSRGSGCHLGQMIKTTTSTLRMIFFLVVGSFSGIWLAPPESEVVDRC